MPVFAGIAAVNFFAAYPQSKPPVNWWYAQPLEGAITDLVPKRDAERFDTALLSQAAAKAAVFFRAYLFLLPVNGSIYSLNVN